MNNKDAIGIYYDASKHKKYEILYDNGKVITQKEISLREESSRVTGSNDND